MTTEKNLPFAKAEMLIRKPVAEVFEAFVNPDITTKFWFTKSSGKLEEGKQVQWTWEMYNLTVPVVVKKIKPNERIAIEWGDESEKTSVEWTFEPMNGNSTFVSVVNEGFTGDVDKVISHIRDSTEGFALVLAGLKAWLEHGIQLNLVGDRFPKGIGELSH
jgi:uncharacterized protein YndB with AHSA1/START domain